MFRGKITTGSFHCMNCGKALPDGQVVCNNCLKDLHKRGVKFEVSSGHRAVDRMESLS